MSLARFLFPDRRMIFVKFKNGFELVEVIDVMPGVISLCHALS